MTTPTIDHEQTQHNGHQIHTIATNNRNSDKLNTANTGGINRNKHSAMLHNTNQPSPKRARPPTQHMRRQWQKQNSSDNTDRTTTSLTAQLQCR